MKYMLDTNICIYVIKHKPEAVIKRFFMHDPRELCISSITYAELMYGVEKSQKVDKNRLAMMLFLSPITILDFSARAAEEYGKIRADLEKQGTPIGPLDMQIAGHAKAEELILVTNNTREFLRVKDLEVEDSVKKTIIDNIMDENGNDVNAEKAKTETAQNEVKVKEGVIESLNTKIKELGDIDIEQIKKEQFDLGKAEGSKEVEEFKKDYCIHSMPFSAFMSIKDDLEVADIPYGMKVVTNDEDKKIASIYFENKHLERYSELGFNNVGQIRVYGSDNKNMQWNINSQDEIISFKTKLGEQERQTYETLSGKNYIMKRTENECVWTVFKNDIKELAEKEKKRNVVNEDLEKHNIFEELEKEVANSPTLTEDKIIEINIADEKEVGE